MMGSGIPPMIQMIEVGDLGSMDSREFKFEAEPLKIGLNGLERRVLLAELQSRSELRLDGCLKIGRNRSRANLGAFRVESPAKPLKVGTEQHDVAAKGLIQ